MTYVLVLHSVKPQHQGGSRSVHCAQGQQCAGTSLCSNHSIRVTVSTLCTRSAMCRYFTLFKPQHQGHSQYFVRKVSNVLVLHSVKPQHQGHSQHSVQKVNSDVCAGSSLCSKHSISHRQYSLHAVNSVLLFLSV